MRIEQDRYVEGWVVANDKYGDIGYAIVVNDDTGGVEVAIDSRNVDDVVELYSYIRLHCSGLYIGREGARFVIGKQPTDRYVVDRIPESEILNHVEVVPSTAIPPAASVMRICDIDASDVMSYARIDSIRVVDEQRGMTWCDSDTTLDERYSLRHFTDGRDTLPIIMSHDCDYATEHIPIKPCTVIGVIDWYEQRCVLRIVAHQIVEK